MALELYKTSPVFQMHFDYCCQILQKDYQINIKDALWSSSGTSCRDEDIHRTIYSQTSIFCVEYALLKLWESLGVKPSFVLGHSLGEFCAAVSAGILGLRDALKLVAERSLLVDQLPPGKMLVIKADLSQVKVTIQRFLSANVNKDFSLDIAAVNSAEQTVVAGDTLVIKEFSHYLTEVCKLKNHVLDSSHAFHSKHMDPILQDYRKVAEGISSNSIENDGQKNPVFISSVLGTPISNSENVITADYWVNHTRQEVRFLAASKEAVELGCRIFIEIGPQPILSALTLLNNENSRVQLTCLPSLKRNEDSWLTFFTSLGKLYVRGQSSTEIDWLGLDDFHHRKKVRLPHYPFMGKQFWPDMTSTRGMAIHPLIGVPFPNATSTKVFQAALNLRFLEYLKDHVVGSHVILPGAAFLEMCLAAGMASFTEGPAGIRTGVPMKVENLQIQAPLELLENRSQHLQILVDHDQDQNAGIKIFQEVKVVESDYKKSTWLTHATGTFSPFLESPEKDKGIDTGDETLLQAFQRIVKTDCSEDDLKQIYDKCASVGLKFGPVFRSVVKIWKRRDEISQKTEVIAKIQVPEQNQTAQGRCSYILHPVVIDAMIQSILVLRLTSNMKRRLFVPISIGKFVWLGSSSYSTDDLYVYAYDTNTSSADPLLTSGCTAVLMEASSGTPLAIMSSVEFLYTTAKAIESLLEQQTNSMPDLWEEIWHQTPGATQNRFQLEVIHAEQVMNQEGMELFAENYNGVHPVFLELEQFCYWNVLWALYDCGWDPHVHFNFNQDELKKQLQMDKTFSKMLGHYLHVLSLESILELEDLEHENQEASLSKRWRILQLPPKPGQIEILLESAARQLSHVFRATNLFQEIGRNLAAILKGKHSALEIFFPGKENGGKEKCSLYDFYDEYGRVFKLRQGLEHVLFAYLQQCKRKVPNSGSLRLRILEIGGGTGASTNSFLETLRDLELQFEYTFTDISPAFFPQAQKRFQEFSKNMRFQKLNIEEDPISQGFIPEYFDMILAQDVVHATKNIAETLENVRILLKPLGRFAMMDQSRVNRPITFLFGLLEGFWRFEDSDVRKDHCTLSIAQWENVFTSSGFEVIESWQMLDDHHSCFSVNKLPVSDGAESKPGKPKYSWILFHLPGDKISEFLLHKLESLSGRQVIQITEQDVGDNYSSDIVDAQIRENASTLEGIIYCWSLEKEKEKFSLEKLIHPYFHLLQTLPKVTVKNSFRLICITGNAVTVPSDGTSENVGPAMIWGLTKTFRNEVVNAKCCMIDVSEDYYEADPGGPEMMEIFYQIWNTEKESQVTLRASQNRYVPKLTPLKSNLKDLKLPFGADRFQLLLPETRSIQDLEFGQLDLETFSHLEGDEIEVQIKVSALNFRDLFSVMKPTEQFQDLNSVGSDFAGVVKKIGENVSKWKIGDRVFGVNAQNSPLPSHVKLHEDEVLRVPKAWTLHEAATLPAVACTALHCLVEVSKVKSTDTVLIHTASGGVGLAAVQICKKIGVPLDKIICTAGSTRKRNYLRKTLGIQHVFHSRSLEYGPKIMEATRGQGVTVVLNSLTGEGFKETTLEVCAQGARFVEMSKLSIWEPEVVRDLRPDVEYYIVDLSRMDESELRRHIKTVEERLLGRGNFEPIPYTRFDAVNIREALQYLQKARHIGKVVVVMPEAAKPGTGSPEVITPLFNSDSTYLITGGLGGIGFTFTVCQWMVQKHGARNIVLAGRSPPTAKILEAISKLINNDPDAPGESKVNVIAVSVDVSNFYQLKDLIDRKIPETWKLPPLRGVMHCAGTLHDGLMENQEWSTFSTTFPAKVTGTLNLHELTKNLRLEHFVLFSSITSLFGSPSQGNHTAGNCFQDAFAHHRYSLCLPATTINWGPWGQVGVATEIDLPGLRPLSNLQGLSVLEFALRAQRIQTCAVNIDSFVMLSKLFPHFQSYISEQLMRGQGSSGSGGFGTSSLNWNARANEFWDKYDSVEQECEQIDEVRPQKLELVKDLLKQVLRQSLQLEETEEIDEERNFQDMGVDSLMLVEIKNYLQTMMRDRCTLNASVLRDCSTLRILSDRVVALIEGEEIAGGEELEQPPPEEVAALIREDSQIPEHIRSQPGQVPVNLTDIKTCLVTGCTGTLGMYILKELTSRPQVTQVICLMRVQKSWKGSAKERLKKILKDRQLLQEVDLGKVRVVSGNVTEDHLGMEDGLWKELGNDVDAVFHCAALVQHMEHYRKRKSNSDMRAVNIQGTKNVLELCVSGRKLKRLCHFSGFIAAANVDEAGRISEKWPQVSDFDGVTTFSYPITKFVGDLLLKEAVLNRGIPAKVIRLPIIFGHSKTGRFLLENNHAMLRYLFILKTGVISSSPFPLMLLPVDICASSSVQLFFDERCPNEIYNLCHNRPRVDQEFVGVAERLGYEVKVVEVSEFMERVKTFGNEEEKNSPFILIKELYTDENEKDALSIVSTVPAAKHWVNEAGGGGSEKESENFFTSEKVLGFLPQFYDHLEPSMEYLYRDLKFAKDAGWLRKYGL